MFFTAIMFFYKNKNFSQTGTETGRMKVKVMSVITRPHKEQNKINDYALFSKQVSMFPDGYYVLRLRKHIAPLRSTTHRVASLRDSSMIMHPKIIVSSTFCQSDWT